MTQQLANTSSFQEHMEIEHQDYKLIIEKRLSSGFTSEVFKGTLYNPNDPNGEKIVVAIKVMRSLEYAAAQRLFQEEGMTLSLLMSIEKEWNAQEEQDPPIKVAPVYYGMSEWNGHPYLVMEFIHGRQIPDLLREYGHLNEHDAARIAWQLYHLLNILHVKLQKTYIDLKFDNLWWVEGEDGSPGYLKVTDLGTLDSIREKQESARLRSIKRDLLLAGVYLCGMVSGKILRYSYGELLEQATPVIHKTDVSWETQQLLRWLLHPNPEARPQSAAEVEDRLKWLVDCWDKDPQNLLSIAENNLSRARGSEDGNEVNKFARKARVALGVLHKKMAGQFTPEADSLLEQVNEVLKSSDYLERGMALFMGRSYKEALSLFETGYEWADTPARLRQWAVLTRLAMEADSEQFDPVKEEWVAILELMNAGDLHAAEIRIRELHQFEGMVAYQSLLAECVMNIAMENAHREHANQHYRQAAEHYRAALNAQKQMLYSEKVMQNETGDIRPYAEDMERRSRGDEDGLRMMRDVLQRLSENPPVTQLNEWGEIAAEQDQASIEDGISAGSKSQLSDTERGIEADVEEAFSITLDRFAFSRLLGEAIYQSINQHQFLLAYRLALIGSRENPPVNDLDTARVVANDFWNANRAFIEKRHDTVTQILAGLLFKAIPGREDVITGTARWFLSRMKAEAEQTNRPDLFRQSAELARSLKEDDLALQFIKTSEDIETREKDKATKIVDEHIQWMSTMLYLEDPQGVSQHLADRTAPASFQLIASRLKEVAARMVECRRVAEPLNYRLDEINEIADNLAAIQTRVQKDRENDAQFHELEEKTLADLKRQRSRIEELEQIPQQVEQLGISNASLQSLSIDISQNQIRFLEGCYQYLQRYQLELELVKGYIEWVVPRINHVGVETLETILKQVQEQLNFALRQLDEVKQLLNQGNLNEARAQLTSLEAEYGRTPEWKGLKDQISKVDAWRAWVEENTLVLGQGLFDEGILKTLETYKESGIPLVYLQDRLVHQYLDECLKSLGNKYKELDKNDPQFFKIVKRAIRVMELQKFYQAGNAGGKA